MAKNNWGKSRLPNPRLYELRFTANHHGDKAYRYLNFSELSGEKLHTIKLSFSTHAATKTYIKLQVIILESIILIRLSSPQIGQKTIISFNGWGICD